MYISSKSSNSRIIEEMSYYAYVRIFNLPASGSPTCDLQNSIFQYFDIFIFWLFDSWKSQIPRTFQRNCLILESLGSLRRNYFSTSLRYREKFRSSRRNLLTETLRETLKNTAFRTDKKLISNCNSRTLLNIFRLSTVLMSLAYNKWYK